MQGRAYEQTRSRLVSSAKKTRTPILGHFELTARCNLDCKMCYVHTMDNAVALRKELSTEQWKRIFDEAIACNMMYATLSGGECLIRKDFKELYLHLWNKNVYVTVMTNGTLLNADYVEFFKTYRPDMIQISIYGSCEEGYLSLAGHKGFEKAVTAVKALQDAGIDVRVVVTPSKYMIDDYINTVRTCKEMGFQLSLTDVTLIPNRDDPDKDDYYLTQDETIDLLKKRAELYGMKLTPAEAPEACGPMTEEPGKGLTCNAGNCLYTIIWDGRMFPCANAIIGEGASVLEMSVAEAWEKTKETVDAVVYGAECVGCPYDKICSKCPSIRLKDLHSGHCNPQMCEMTRKLVASGIKKLKQD
ncbi:MAG: radical SAM protein [Oscillospiraceae bacterium]|nr:radical SAM protein [Oscillospiraceae bacterium]